MEIHNHNNSCNQYSGNRSLICDLFQDTGDNIRMFNIEQGARIAKFEGDKQYVAKCLVICFCSWSLKYFKKLKKNVLFGNVPLHGEVIIRNHSSFLNFSHNILLKYTIAKASKEIMKKKVSV